MLHLSRRRFIPTMGGGAAAAASYATVLQDTYGASEVWPLVNISSGTTITAFIDSARNGTLTGWDLQNAAGPVTGTLAPYSDGANDYGDIETASLVSIASIVKGSLFGWFKPTTASLTDGILRRPFIIFHTGTNYISLSKTTNNNQFNIRRNADAGNTSINFNINNNNWFSFGAAWDESINSFIAAVNGASIGSGACPAATGGAMTASILGAINTNPQNVHAGHLAYFSVNYSSTNWTIADFLAMHNAAATAGAD